MKVSELQKFLRALADVLAASAGASPAGDLRKLADVMEPFAGEGVAAFCKAVEGLGNAGPPARVTAAIAAVKELNARALDPDVTPELVESKVGAFAGYTLNDLKAIAAGVGMSRGFTRKDPVLKALKEHVLGRKGSFERAQR